MACAGDDGRCIAVEARAGATIGDAAVGAFKRLDVGGNCVVVTSTGDSINVCQDGHEGRGEMLACLKAFR